MRLQFGLKIGKIINFLSPLGRPPHLRSWNNIPGTPCWIQVKYVGEGKVLV